MSRTPWTLSLALALASCSGGEEEAPPPDPVEEGCYLIAEGTVIDAGATPEEATELALGIDPWRVGLYPDQVSFVSLTTTGKTLVVMADALDVFASLETGGEAVELPDPYENPTCGQDIPAVLELDLPAGTHILGVGPHYKATIWMLVAEKD
jgi:hypothetical protein